MTQSLPGIPALVWDTIRAPRQTAERIIGMNLPIRSLWEALALGVLLTVIVVVGLMLGAPADPTDPASAALQEMYAQPMVVAVGQIISSVTTVFAVFWIGRWFGGRGTLEGSVALVAWHQIFLLCVAIVGMVVGIVFPPILSVLLIGLIGLYFYVLTQFVCTLHGFENAAPVFLMIVISFVAILTAVSILTGILAVIFLGDAPNV